MEALLHTPNLMLLLLSTNKDLCCAVLGTPICTQAVKCTEAQTQSRRAQLGWVSSVLPLCSQTQSWQVTVSYKARRGQGDDRGFETSVTRRELNLFRWEFRHFIQPRLSYGRWKLKRQAANSDVGLEEKKAS